MERLRIFVASPGDVPKERHAVSRIVEELRRTVASYRDVDLEAVLWETHTWPDVGQDAQDVINSQIGEYDIFIGIMWKRFGTPTPRAESGTGEEFERAYKYLEEFGRPKIMFYFKTQPFYPDERDLAHFKKICKFKRKLRNNGVLFSEYSNPLDFERKIREHITQQIMKITERPLKRELGGAQIGFGDA